MSLVFLTELNLFSDRGWNVSQCACCFILGGVEHFGGFQKKDHEMNVVIYLNFGLFTRTNVEWNHVNRWLSAGMMGIRAGQDVLLLFLVFRLLVRLLLDIGADIPAAGCAKFVQPSLP